MKQLQIIALVSIALLHGCAAVPMEPTELSEAAKAFERPSPDRAGIYVYRANTHFGAALKKTVWIDDECIGETSKGVFFYHEVDGDKQHKVSTESEFSPNAIFLDMESGKLYFVEQYIKMGVFVGGAGLRQTDEAVGRQEVLALKLAKKGDCGQAVSKN